MHHKSSHSHHVHILMSGHNPEHHHENRSHRGTSNVHHHMKHTDKHHNHHSNSHHHDSRKPCDILMREHHYSGGITNVAPHYSKGGKACRGNRFAKGGHVDQMDQNEGSPVEERQEKRRGGRTKRKHHFFGQSVIGKYPLIPFKEGGHCYAEGGETKRDYGEKPLTGQLRKGGRARHHYKGESIHEGSPVEDRQEKRKGGRTKRQHHYWGQSVIGRLPIIGGIANSIANTAGTLDPHKYGGSEYVANTKGQKAADILSTIGNLGVLALKKGGGVHHKHRHHHAAGGAGKVRKGMMTKSGHMIHHDL